MAEPEPTLRAAFATASQRVEVARDALDTIRARVGQRARRRRRLAVGLAAVATATVTAGGVAFALGRQAPDAGPPASSPTAAPPTSTMDSPAPPAPVAVRVPVYFVVGDRLYREFRDTTAVGDALPDRLAAAVKLALTGAALDSDYGTAWPPGVQLSGTTVDDGVATIALTGLGAAVDPLAAQQLVYTVTAVAADRGTPLTGVRLLVNGAGQVLLRAPELDTLAPLWLISPQEGARVATTFDVHVSGAVFEAAARLRVRDAGGAVVRDQPVQLSAGAPQRGEAHVAMTLVPGTYTIEVYYVAARDGSEQGLDDHEITVA